MLTAPAKRFPYHPVLRHCNFRLFWFGLVAQVSGQPIFNITTGFPMTQARTGQQNADNRRANILSTICES